MVNNWFGFARLTCNLNCLQLADKVNFDKSSTFARVLLLRPLKGLKTCSDLHHSGRGLFI